MSNLRIINKSTSMPIAFAVPYFLEIDSTNNWIKNSKNKIDPKRNNKVKLLLYGTAPDIFFSK